MFGQCLVSVVADAQLESSPDWEDDQLNPPLSARKAIAAASAIAGTSFDARLHPEWKMKLKEATIMHVEDAKWVWVVRYVAELKKGGATGMPSYLDVVVCMNGKAITPQKCAPPKTRN